MHVCMCLCRCGSDTVLQGMCLFLVWITFQCGMLVRSTTPNVTTGNAFLIAVSVANIVILLSPVFLALIAVCGLVPEHVRRRVSTMFINSDGPPLPASDDSDHSTGAEDPEKSNHRDLAATVVMSDPSAALPPNESMTATTAVPDIVPITIEMTASAFIPRDRGDSSSTWGAGRERGSSQWDAQLFEPTFFSNSSATEDGDDDSDTHVDNSHVKR
jgi:hypothetical protein